MGGFVSTYKQFFPSKPSFSIEDIPDLTGRVVLVTGGNSGIGYQTAKALLCKNAKVYLTSRDPAKGKEAIEKLKSETGKVAHLLVLDLSSLKSVKTAAEEFTGKESELNILFNNAGVMRPPKGQFTMDGYDLQWGTNVVGPFYLTQLLLPLLLAGANTRKSKARVVTTSSYASELTSKLDWGLFKEGPELSKASPAALYTQSKFANVIVATELARRYGDQGIVSTSVNPGNIKTELVRHLSSLQVRIFSSLLLYPVEYGALTQLYAGTHSDTEELNGKYFAPWARLYPPNPASQDPKLGKDLWNWLEEQVKDI